MKDKISVLVPIYNKELYLSRCMDSICGQTYQNLEIILVDDGSTDGSASICDEYAEKDNRIQVYHQKNQGVADARNAALHYAKGDYIAFVDTDDYIDVNMYERLLDTLIATKADIVICGYRYVDENEVVLQEESPVTDELLTSYQALEKLHTKKWWYYVTLPNRLHRREVFEHIVFPSGKIHEDYATAPHIFLACNLVATVSICFYAYRNTSHSIMTSKISINRLDGVEAAYNRFLLYEKLGYMELLPGTFYSALGSCQVICHIRCTTKEERQRKREIKKMFRYLFYKTRGVKTIKNYVAVFTPEFYYRLRELMKHS